MTDARPDHRTWDRLSALSRDDKWYLSSGDGLLWAPPFPRWLHRPGFWDEARLYHVPLQPCFTVALLSADGSEDPLERQQSEWRPERLRVHWRSRSGLSFTESRYLLPGGKLCSAWRTAEDLGWPNPVFHDRLLAAYTSAPARQVEEVERRGAGLAWRRALPAGDAEEPLHVHQTLEPHLIPPWGHRGAETVGRDALPDFLEATWSAAALSDGRAGPEWDWSPFAEAFAERFRERRPPWPEEEPEAGDAGDHLHLAVVLPLRKIPARHAVAFVLRVVPRLTAPPEAGERGEGSVVGPSAPARGMETERPDAVPRPAAAREAWARAFARYPRFRCSDPYLSGYADYRIYGLHLNRLAGGRSRLPHPAVAEGIGPLHHPTAASAPCHMLETRWSTDASVARGTLLNFVAHQRPDGSFPTRLYVHRPPDDAVCQMNWGDAVRAVDRLHPQHSFLERAYGALSRYGAWVSRTRDPEGSGLVTVRRAQEANQDHTPRWEAASGTELKAVDASTCAVRLWLALAEMAEALGHDDEAGEWHALHRRSAEALDGLWDDEAGIYRDLDPATGDLTDIASSAGFRPLLTDLPDPERVRRLLAHLEPGGAFATPFPVPSLSTDDPRFDAEGFWRGRRRERPFNGRVWPTITCQVLEGLVRQWHRGIREAGVAAARILPAFVRMMHRPGDPSRPNAWEHYNPLTGHPSRFRGLDDHQRSWVLDLILRGAAGVEPLPDRLRIHPLPLALRSVEMEAEVRGRRLRVTLSGESVEASLGGDRVRGSVGEPLEMPW